jgi:hypothetical protein
MMIFCASAYSQTINQNDYNYLNKGYWQISANGFEPRKDLTLTELSTQKLKVGYGEKNYSTYKICKDSVFQGIIISTSTTYTTDESRDNSKYNLFMLTKQNPIIYKHNEDFLKNNFVNDDIIRGFLKIISGTQILSVNRTCSN